MARLCGSSSRHQLDTESPQWDPIVATSEGATRSGVVPGLLETCRVPGDSHSASSRRVLQAADHRPIRKSPPASMIGR